MCGSRDGKTLVAIRAEQFCRLNSTYRAEAWENLGIQRDASFPIVECRCCRFVFAGLLPSPEFLETIYETVIDAQRGLFEAGDPAWVAHQLELGGLLLRGLAAAFAFEHDFRVLDFGCGYGSLVNALSGPRVRCLGYESSRRRLAFLRDNGIPASDTIDAVRKEGPFHAVVLSDVLEHVSDPRRLLGTCRDLLAPNGLLLVNVPNFEERRLRAARQDLTRGVHRDREVNPWEHLNYFSPRSLDRMLKDEGLRVVDMARPVDIGLRAGLTGTRRWVNAVRSAGRLGWRLVAPRTVGTCRLAQRCPTFRRDSVPDSRGDERRG